MDMQADSAGRALSSVVTKMIKNKGFPFSIYSILYQACVCSVSQYGSEVFGFDKFDSTFKLHLRAARAFLGLPKNVTSYGLVSELDWLLPHFQTQIKMIQYFNRIMSTLTVYCTKFLLGTQISTYGKMSQLGHRK